MIMNTKHRANETLVIIHEEDDDKRTSDSGRVYKPSDTDDVTVGENFITIREEDQADSDWVIEIDDASDEIFQQPSTDAAPHLLNRRLRHACKIGDAELVRSLVQKGADVNSEGQVGQASLLVASWHGHVGIAQFLLDHGARIDTVDSVERSALMLHLERSLASEKLITLMLERGADANAVDLHQRTPLMYACKTSGNAHIVHLLLRNGADVNAVDKNGNTPLMHAVASFKTAPKGKLEIVATLLAHRARVTVSNKRGETPLQLAMQLTEAPDYFQNAHHEEVKKLVYCLLACTAHGKKQPRSCKPILEPEKPDEDEDGEISVPFNQWEFKTI